MHFFSFVMNDQVRTAYTEAGHRLLLFGRTREAAADGTTLCLIIGSGNCAADLVVIALDHSARVDVDKRIAGYFVHSAEEVERGILLGNQETKAKEN